MSMLALAKGVLDKAHALGADEATVSAGSSTHVSLQRRGGQVEQATEASTHGITVSVLVDGRYTSNGTSDLRPEALDGFLRRCIDSARYLEPDPDRALPDVALCGRGVSEEALDQNDPSWADQTAETRGARAEALEQAVRERHPEGTISSSVFLADGESQSARVMSNGFEGENRGAWFAAGGEITLKDGEKRPEAYVQFSARHQADLPSIDALADALILRANERIGGGPIASGTYPMILENRAAGRLLGVLASGLSGAALHHGRSFLANKQGERLGSDLLHLVDDPTLARGLGSRPWDGDALASTPRVIVENGVLSQYYIDVYHGRKLGMQPTTGGRSNWILPTGDQSWSAMCKDIPKAILVSGFLGGNSNSTTGDFSFGILGRLVEYGQPTRSLAEMNVGGNALDIFHRLVGVGNDPWQYSSCISPSLLFDEVSFSGS